MVRAVRMREGGGGYICCPERVLLQAIGLAKWWGWDNSRTSGPQSGEGGRESLCA